MKSFSNGYEVNSIGFISRTNYELIKIEQKGMTVDQDFY